MFDRLVEVIYQVKQLSVQKIAVEIWKESDVQRYILDLNRINQLFERGVNADERVIGYYSQVTEAMSAGQTFTYEGHSHQKRAGEPYTLLDTSYFYRSFKVVLDDGGFKIYADDEKDGEYLTETYDQTILGLTQENKQELARHILNRVIELVRTQILAPLPY